MTALERTSQGPGRGRGASHGPGGSWRVNRGLRPLNDLLQQFHLKKLNDNTIVLPKSTENENFYGECLPFPSKCRVHMEWLRYGKEPARVLKIITCIMKVLIVIQFRSNSHCPYIWVEQFHLNEGW